MFADILVLSALEAKVQIISVYYKTPCSVPKQHTEWDNAYLQLNYPWVSTNLQAIQTAGCTMVTLDRLFTVICPLCVQEG